MASTKTKPAQTQAQRLLEARKKQVAESGSGFARAMGKIAMARQARKTAKGQIGG
jgi:hypothetical protein